jgi:hypothetical protein
VERYLRSRTVVISASSAYTDILRGAALYVVAIYLLLAKMTASEPGMGCVKAWQNCQERAMEVVRATKQHIDNTSCPKYFCWPMLVIGVAARGSVEDVELIRWVFSFCLVRRWRKLFLKIGSGEFEDNRMLTLLNG